MTTPMPCPQFVPRMNELLELADRDAPPMQSLAPAVLAQTTTTSSYPTAASVYYAVQPLVLLGSEVEGASGNTSNDGVVFYALNLGTAVPPFGTAVLATYAGNRWVFRYD